MTDKQTRGCSVFPLEELDEQPSPINQGAFFARILGETRPQAWALYKARIEPGCELVAHSHALSETFLVVAGTVHCVLENATFEVKATEVGRIEESVVHTIQNRGETAAIMLTILSPDI